MLSNPNLNFRYFPKHDETFAKFVFENRLHNVYNNIPHGFDIIWGVMSDNRPDLILTEYGAGDLSYEDAIHALQKANSMKQLYLGNQTLCNKLEIVSVIKGGLYK